MPHLRPLWNEDTNQGSFVHRSALQKRRSTDQLSFHSGSQSQVVIRVPAVISHEPALVYRAGVGTVLLSGQMALADAAVTLNTVDVGLDTAQTRKEEHECQPHEVVSDCNGVVQAVQALQTGRRTPKGRNRDLALSPAQRIPWMKAHKQQAAVERGTVTADELHDNGQADVVFF
eukprot:4210645-Amphidinium_carterae.1